VREKPKKYLDATLLNKKVLKTGGKAGEHAGGNGGGTKLPVGEKNREVGKTVNCDGGVGKNSLAKQKQNQREEEGNRYF